MFIITLFMHILIYVYIYIIHIFMKIIFYDINATANNVIHRITNISKVDIITNHRKIFV